MKSCFLHGAGLPPGFPLQLSPSHNQIWLAALIRSALQPCHMLISAAMTQKMA